MKNGVLGINEYAKNWPHLFKRMDEDSWQYCIRLKDGTNLSVESIDKPKQMGDVWFVDCTISQFLDSHLEDFPKLKFFVPPARDRMVVTVALDDISFIYELADT